MRAFSAMMIPLLLTVSAAAQAVEAIDQADQSVVDIDEETEIGGGMASYYGNELAGNRTASGERFDPGRVEPDPIPPCAGADSWALLPPIRHH